MKVHSQSIKMKDNNLIVKSQHADNCFLVMQKSN